MNLPVSLILLSTTVAQLPGTPIEPALVAIQDEAQQIDLQMGKYEVTVAEFSRFVAVTQYQVPKKCMLFTSTRWPDPDSPGNWDDPELVANSYRPVVCIGMSGALAYAQWLAEQTGKPYRLPTRKEWQFAASAGTKNRLPFGEDRQQTQICKYENTEDLANLAGMQIDHQHRYKSSARCNDGAVYHTVIGMYRPNAFGLHDMLGNVKELLQSCHSWDQEKPQQCAQYHVAGEGWHWQTRGVFNPDTIAADFYGSIEGFRLVLDQPARKKETPFDGQFAQAVADAQQLARQAQQRLQQIPPAPTGVRASRDKNNRVTISWQEIEEQSVQYAVYRSYLDPQGALSRKFQRIGDDLKSGQFVDQLPGGGLASYTVAALTSAGQGPFSQPIATGVHPTFKVGQRIEAEHYFAQDNTYLLAPTQSRGQSLAFSENPHHYPTGDKPLLVPWSSYRFTNSEPQSAELQVKLRADDAARIEFWQGHHLVARIENTPSNAMHLVKVPATLIASDAPLEIRALGQHWFAIDWLQFVPPSAPAR
ncbi:SUMF1/EgtB/PvdO family nonheme iron enzyme [Pseudoalteromonas sp. DL2-H2.2]|uniref:formylglycine-generating enzyme family protein n=1 Tax=Pseudoalteromonas sp. DL2-H2.2 TaxID=2908889 RepID=UPI001F42C361|nr:SUMF1/EgtB/PvdO family nonheme iron enzyme [Pseudoalteromonas sp. DL2-H2.2]MCF2909620.1 SUMF1/EgtB/PvdO family nonheme iron enzyme [Pseudoalteromonas sp. DL2-H2.2]